MDHTFEAANNPTLAAAARPPKLTRECELELARRWRDDRDEAARDALLRAHLSTVEIVARRYRRHSATLDELISEGNFGLLHAIDKFDPDRGARLVTYAVYWIRAYVLGHVVRSRCLVSSGMHSKLLGRLRRARAAAARVGDASLAEARLAEVLGVSSEKVRELSQRLDCYDVSLSTTFADSTEEAGLFAAAASAEECLLGQEASRKARERVARALRDLDERERYIVQRRLMADEGERLSLAQIGRDLRISRERARQLEDRAKQKLAKRLADCAHSLEASPWHSAA